MFITVCGWLKKRGFVCVIESEIVVELSRVVLCCVVGLEKKYELSLSSSK